jgi:hypothetical protein
VAISFWRGKKPKTTHEADAQTRVTADLKRIYSASDEPVVVAFDVWFPGADTDMLVLKHDALIVVEMKHCAEIIRGSVNGDWEIIDGSGPPATLEGGTFENPFQQIQSYYYKFRDYLEANKTLFLEEQPASQIHFRSPKRTDKGSSGFKAAKIDAILAFDPKYHPESRIDVRKNWLRFSGLNDLAKRIDDTHSGHAFTEKDLIKLVRVMGCKPDRSYSEAPVTMAAAAGLRPSRPQADSVPPAREILPPIRPSAAAPGLTPSLGLAATLDRPPAANSGASTPSDLIQRPVDPRAPKPSTESLGRSRIVTVKRPDNPRPPKPVGLSGPAIGPAAPERVRANPDHRAAPLSISPESPLPLLLPKQSTNTQTSSHAEPAPVIPKAVPVHAPPQPPGQTVVQPTSCGGPAPAGPNDPTALAPQPKTPQPAAIVAEDGYMGQPAIRSSARRTGGYYWEDGLRHGPAELPETPPFELWAFLSGSSSKWIDLPSTSIQSIRSKRVGSRYWPAYESSVMGIAVSADGRRAVSASLDKTLTVWDLETLSQLRTLSGHTQFVFDVALTPDGQRAVSASSDGTLKMWDVESGMELRTLAGHSLPVRRVAISGDGRLAVSASQDCSLKVWDLETGAELSRLVGHSSFLGGVAINSAATRAVSTSQDHTLKVWNLQSGEEISTLTDSSTPTRVVLGGGGRWAVCGSGDGTIKLWNLEIGAMLRTLRGHSGAISGLALSADDRWLVSGAHDNTVKVWDLTAAKIAATFHYDSAVECCAIADVRNILAGDRGGYVHFLQLDIEPQT